MRAFMPRLYLLSLLLVVLVGVAFAAETALDPRVQIGAGAEYGYWAPEIHEMYLRVPVKALPIGGEEIFSPRGVTIDGKPATYAFWYVSGHTIDYDAAKEASKQQIAVFLPITWRANEQHEVHIRYSYGGTEGEQRVTIPTPKTGGAWNAAVAGNQAFLIREEAGLPRSHEPVDLDLTVPQALFPDPARTMRATIMTAPGVFTEIPCQVYDVEAYGKDRRAFVRFRAVVQMSVKAKSQALVHLWSCAPAAEDAVVPSPLRLQGTALGGIVSNTDYDIELDSTCGQMYRWHEKRLKTIFAYVDPRKGVEGNAVVIHRTPDVFRPDKPWSHAFDWRHPENRAITGPVLCETIRWGEMPDVPEVYSRVSYRFFAHRPDVRVASSMRVTKDLQVNGLRMGNMILTGADYTHIAWPRQDGSIVRITIEQALGNDMGAPPAARFPFNTPWVAFYHREKKIGIAMITANLAYFTDGPGHPNQSRIIGYASWYRQYGLYSIRSATQTYCAFMYTYPTPLHAGTVMYEDVAYLPFSFTREDDKQFLPVTTLLKEMLNPLVVAP